MFFALASELPAHLSWRRCSFQNLKACKFLGSHSPRVVAALRQQIFFHLFWQLLTDQCCCGPVAQPTSLPALLPNKCSPQRSIILWSLIPNFALLHRYPDVLFFLMVSTTIFLNSGGISFVWYSWGKKNPTFCSDSISYCLTNGVLFICFAAGGSRFRKV